MSLGRLRSLPLRRFRALPFLLLAGLARSLLLLTLCANGLLLCALSLLLLSKLLLLFPLGAQGLLLLTLYALLFTHRLLLRCHRLLSALLLDHLLLAKPRRFLCGTLGLLGLLRRALALHHALLLERPVVVLRGRNVRGRQPNGRDQKKKVKSEGKGLDQIHGVTVSEGAPFPYTREGNERHR